MNIKYIYIYILQNNNFLNQQVRRCPHGVTSLGSKLCCCPYKFPAYNNKRFKIDHDRWFCLNRRMFPQLQPVLLREHCINCFFRSLTIFRPHLAPHREQYLHYKPKSHKRKSGACISPQFHRKSESVDKLQKKSEIFCFTKSCVQSYSSKERDKLAVWRTDRHDLVNSRFAKTPRHLKT